MNRSLSRELVFKFLYELEILKEENYEEQLNLYIENNNITNSDTIQYIKQIVEGIKNNKDNISELISKNLKKDWSIERISKVNLAILKLAIYEIKYMELPYKVGINEAVEIAKIYGDDTAGQFVYGVLASILKEETKHINIGGKIEHKSYISK